MKGIGKGIVAALWLIGCQATEESAAVLKTGIWRAAITIQGQSLPFNFEVNVDSLGSYTLYLFNAEEKIMLDEVTLTGDSVDIVLHIFDANIKAKINGDSLHGEFIKNYAADYRLPFRAVYGQSNRFEERTSKEEMPDFSGKYAVRFFDDKDTIPAIGVFDQKGEKVTGTFLTPTGDYRYLEGSIGNNGLLQLSTFDGNHAYLFRANKQKDGTLRGEYYSGKTLKQAWIGEKNENATLPDAGKLTYLKKGYERVSFNFPDVAGRPTQLTDEKYKNKVIILQLFGTWCPNCLDETKFLTAWYEKNKKRGVEIIGLAYERKDDFAYAQERILKMRNRFNVPYDILVAGTDDKTEASKTLPMLNAIFAFPTTIFVGKDGLVKKIHTGFSGPGTGVYYDEFVQHFNETVNELLKEDYTSMKD